MCAATGSPFSAKCSAPAATDPGPPVAASTADFDQDQAAVGAGGHRGVGGLESDKGCDEAAVQLVDPPAGAEAEHEADEHGGSLRAEPVPGALS